MEEKYIVAIEIGSSKIRGALGAVDSSGITNILAIQEEPIADSVRYGQIRNIEEVANTIDAICVKLENVKAIQPRKISSVYVGLSGFSIASSDQSATIKFGGETEITAMVINELKEKAADNHFSEKEIYEIVPTEYAVDKDITPKPVGCFGNSVRGSYKVIEGNPGIKSNINRVLPERLKFEINGYIVSALASADNVLSTEEKSLGCMFVDFGAETTTVAIYKGGVLKSLVTLPMGSRNITRDLMSLNYLEEQAETLKRNVGIATSDSSNLSDQPEIGNYIHARAVEIVANVIAQIEFAELKASELPSGIIIVGGGARLKGLSEMIAEQSKMKVRRGTAPRNIRISDASVLADDAIDVISLVLDAASSNPVDCLSVIIPEPEETAATNAKNYDDYYDDDPNESRIGKLDDEDEPIDPDDYQEYEEWKKKHKNAKKSGDREPKRPIKPGANGNGSLIDRITKRLGKIFEGEIGDQFEDNN